MKPSVDVQELIKQSTADVPVSELAKKGFQKVKVLNRNTINATLVSDALRIAVGVL